MDGTTPENGSSNVDFIRQRWASMGLDRDEAAVQAAAKAMDEEEARCLRQQAQADPDEDIKDAWHQHYEEKAAEHTRDRPTRQREPAINDSVDDIYQSLRDEYCTEPSEPRASPAPEEPEPDEPPPEEPEPTPEARARQTAELTEECPLYIINRQLANCRVLTSTERCCIGLLNSLMQKHGYAFVSNEQLSLWLCMKTNSVRNMLAKLSRQGFIRDTGRRHLEIRWVVRVDLQNPKRKVR